VPNPLLAALVTRKALPVLLATLLASFGGCSGGGLWHILFEKEATGEIVVKEKILSGVVFHQSKRKDDKRIVTCHGRNSVYHKVVGDVA